MFYLWAFHLLFIFPTTLNISVGGPVISSATYKAGSFFPFFLISLQIFKFMSHLMKESAPGKNVLKLI